MPKTGIRGIRHQQFINAAISVILQDGLAGISNARIASVAGLSPSLRIISTTEHYCSTRFCDKFFAAVTPMPQSL